MSIPVEREIMYVALEEALGIDRCEVFDDKSLTADYQAEGIDYLDIEFRVRRQLGKDIDEFRMRLQAPLEAAVPPFKSMPDTPARIVELIERSRRVKKK